MALDVAGLHAEAEHAYRWLADIQRPDGSWWNYYLPDGSVEEAKLDTNVCAYIATGVWHHWLCTRRPRRSSTSCGRRCAPRSTGCCRCAAPTARSCGRATPTTARGTTPCSPGRRASPTRCAAARSLAAARRRAPTRLGRRRRPCSPSGWPTAPDAFEPKDRWAMDWYYPVLTGALTGEPAKARLAEGWDTFAMEGKGIRCVSDEAWVTASETAECSIAHAVDRRPVHRHRSARLDPLPPPRRRGVLDRHGLPQPGALPRSARCRPTPARRWSWPPTRSPRRVRPAACSSPPSDVSARRASPPWRRPPRSRR